jgi:hypothetical protein
MDPGPLLPGMVNTVGALLPALIAIGLVVARRARSGLGRADQFWLLVYSLALTAVLARVSVTPDEISLHLVPGATLLVCYLVWCGYYISPGFAFVLAYATCLPVDLFVARLAFGSAFNTENIGGAGWYDGLLVFPALTALAVMYANWRIATGAGRIGVVRAADRRAAAQTGAGQTGADARRRSAIAPPPVPAASAPPPRRRAPRRWTA